MNKFNFFFIVIVNFIYSQDSNYTKTLNYGEKISYEKNDGATNFKKYNSKGDLISSGSLFNLKMLDKDFILSGNFSFYYEESLGDYFIKGQKSSQVFYKFINSNLNGLQYIDGYDWRKKQIIRKENYVAIIGNHLIGSSYKNNTNSKADKSYMHSKFIVDFSNWATLSFEKPFYTVISLPTAYEDEELYYNLELMVKIFLDDFSLYLDHFYKVLLRDDFAKNNDLGYYLNKIQDIKTAVNNNKIYSVFEDLENNVMAKAFAIDNDKEIILKVDQDKWVESSFANRWYILYHELGHDLLNFRHGQGGRMMFNYPTKNYTWEDFFNDRHDMFILFLKKIYPDYENLFLPFPNL